MLLTPSAGSPAAALHAPSSSRNSRLSSGHSRPSSCCSSHGLACSSSTHTVLPSKRLSSAAGTFRGSRSVPLRNRIIAAAAAPRSPPGSSTSGSPGVDPPQKTAADAAGGHTPQQPAAVIGIDFGTSGSGYAAILGPFASGAAQRPIKSCAQWPDDPHSGGELKTKTAILYRGDKVVSGPAGCMHVGLRGLGRGLRGSRQRRAGTWGRLAGSPEAVDSTLKQPACKERSRASKQ